LAFACVVALWVRSYWRGDELYLLSGVRGSWVETCRGSAMYYAARTAIVAPRPNEWSYIRHDDPTAQRLAMDDLEARVARRLHSGFRGGGFAFHAGGLSGQDATVVVLVPLWLPAALFAVAPVLWLRRRRPPPPGRCAACGYDLRATPDRCPECGVVPAPPVSAPFQRQ
jgi:hypothetical protein